MNTTIICPHCKKPFEISDAIQHQIEDELLRAKAEQSKALRRKYDAAAESKLQEAVQKAVAKTQQEAQLQMKREREAAKFKLDKVHQAIELEVEKTKKATELEIKRLRSEAAASKDSEKQLRKQLSNLLEELSKANKAREDAELAARKELLEKEKRIRSDAVKKASDDFNTKIREQEETIKQLHKQLSKAKQSKQRNRDRNSCRERSSNWILKRCSVRVSLLIPSKRLKRGSAVRTFGKRSTSSFT